MSEREPHLKRAFQGRVEGLGQGNAIDFEEYTMANPIDPQLLDKLAEVAVHVGLGLKPGQDLYMTSPIGALPLARKITEHAYKAGAGLVTTFYSDEETTLARYRYGNDESFDHAPGWLYEGVAKAFENNTARLAIAGDNPMLLSGAGPGKGRPRQPRQFEGLPAGAQEDHQFRDQLVDRSLSRHVMGEARVPR